jgi:hypothetical protein
MVIKVDLSHMSGMIRLKILSNVCCYCQLSERYGVHAIDIKHKAI